MTSQALSPDQIHELLQRWQREGLLDSVEVARIEASEAAHAAVPEVPVAKTEPAQPPGVSLVGEALGYAGSALMIAAVAVFVGRGWSDMALAGRLAILVPSALVLLVAGSLLPERLGPAAVRLRAVLWTASTGLVLATCAVIADNGLDFVPRQMLLFAGSVAAVQALVLWILSRHVLLHLATFASLCVAAAGAGDYAEFLGNEAVGIALWSVAVVWIALALAHVIEPPLAAYIVGVFMAETGALTTTTVHWGAVFVVATAAAAVAFAVWQRSLVLLGMATYGLLSAIPSAADRLFPGPTGVAAGLLVAGLVLVASGFWITQHGRKPRHTHTAESET